MTYSLLPHSVTLNFTSIQHFTKVRGPGEPNHVSQAVFLVQVSQLKFCISTLLT